MNKFEFEAAAQAAVETVTKGKAVFYAGTLFVECDSRQAAKIETALIEALKCGVVMCKIGNEAAFDFVK